MVSNATFLRDDTMQVLLNDIVRDLVVTGIENGDGLIALPQLYPGGSPVVVRVRRDGNLFFVTDQGNGYQAAEHMGGHLSYAKIAPTVAKLHGVEYDGQTMFAARTSREWLPNTIIFTGSASRRAVELTAERMAEERDRTVRIKFQERMREAFPNKTAFDVEYRGRSTKEHHFAAMVHSPDHIALFDIVSPHHISINSTIVKFQDVSRLDNSPRNVAVLSNQARMDQADVILLSQADARVISIDVAREVLVHAA